MAYEEYPCAVCERPAHLHALDGLYYCCFGCRLRMSGGPTQLHTPHCEAHAHNLNVGPRKDDEYV
jgi:ribosomal protein L37AE/L43A